MKHKEKQLQMSSSGGIDEKYHAASGEVVCVVLVEKKACSTYVARLYKDARGRGVEKVKILFANQKESKEFFDKTLPALDPVGESTSFFADVENASLDVASAELILLDNSDEMPEAQLRSIVQVVEKTKVPLVLVTSDEAASAGVRAFSKMKKRFIRI